MAEPRWDGSAAADIAKESAKERHDGTMVREKRAGALLGSERLDRPMSVAWVANLAAPYRRPVWDFIAREAELTVYLLESNSVFHKNRGNRGEEWANSGDAAYRVVEIPTWRYSRGERKLYTAKRALPIKEDDVVVLGGWESPAYWQALITARRRGVPTVGFYESTLKTSQFSSGPIAFARRLFFELLDCVVVPGPAAEEALLGMGIPAAKIHVGFNAVDVKAINKSAEQFRKERGPFVPSAGHDFIYIGRLIKLKNLEHLLKAFASFASPHDTLTIVGQGNERGVLEVLARQLGLGERVRFAGPVAYSELASKLAGAQTLVLPSTKEVWGLVVNEALAAGLQVVVSEACGVADSIIGMNGVFVTGTSVVGIADGMLKAKSTWVGPISTPEILAHTPERFGQVFLEAVSEVSER